MRFQTAFFLTLTLLVCPVQHAQQRGSSGSLPTPVDIEGLFGVGAEPPRSAATDLDVYIDASRSMQGFVYDASSAYRTVLTNLLNQIAIAGYQSNRYSFAPVTLINHARFNDLLQPAFYRGKDTPLHTVLNRVSLTPGRIALIVSDFVQSDSNHSATDLIAALRSVLGRRMSTRMLFFRSSFRGDYYIEGPRTTPDAMLRDVYAQLTPTQGRPFYILALTPDVASMERLDAVVLSGLKPSFVFKPGEPAFRVRKRTLHYQQHGAWGLGPWENTHWGPHLRFVELNRHGDSYDLTLALAGEPIFEIHDPARIESQTWSSSNRTGRYSAPQNGTLQVAASKNYDKGEILLSHHIAQMTRKTHEIYRVVVRPGAGNLSAPAITRNWTTDNDSVRNQIHRTYGLSLLLEAMIREISEQTPIDEYFIELQTR